MENESIATQYLNIQKNLSNQLNGLQFRNIDTIYNPLEYGFSAHEEYITTYLNGPKKILFLGMNPGPYGMCQTAVPFGDPQMVKDYLKIRKEVEKPMNESEHKKILGFNSTQKEISGHRFWGYFKSRHEDPQQFFNHAFVRNYIPLAFLRESNNVTPAEIHHEPSLKEVDKYCSEALIQVIDLLQVEVVIGLGRYSEKKVKSVLRKAGRTDVKVLYLKHPSPLATKNELIWRVDTEKLLNDNQLLQYFQ